jgi:hypothetical protein
MRPAKQGPPSDPDRPVDGRDLDAVLRVFQPRTSRRLTRADAVEMRANLLGAVGLLIEWQREDDEAAAAAERREPC